MNLNDFIKKFICKNTLVRLWKPIVGGHEMIAKDDNCVCMEWQLLNDSVWQSEYGDYQVIGVTDIVVDDFYKEAVNIVIDI